MKRRENDTQTRFPLLDWLAPLGSLVWPPCCHYCRARSDEESPFLCPSCWQALLACTGGDYCPCCGCDSSPFSLVEGRCPRCQGKSVAWDGLVRCGVYTGILQSMILAFKNDRTELRHLFSQLTLNSCAGVPFMEEVELWVPVPLHCTRRWLRGYNQSYLLAKSQANSRASISTVLKRTRRTRPQPVATTRAARARNVAGAFAVRRPESVNGKTVCLVDDIKTTGATLAECARELKAAGAVRVYGLVLAVAGHRGC